MAQIHRVVEEDLSVSEKESPLPIRRELDLVNSRIVKRVLRLKKGARIQLMNGKGLICEAVLERVGEKSATVSIIGVKRSPAPRPQIRLIQGLIKGEKNDWIVQKCTEWGVAEIHFIQSENSVVRFQGKSVPKKVDRWKQIALESIRQSGNPFLPEIHWHPDLFSFLEDMPEGVCILLDETEKSESLVRAFGNVDFSKGVSLAVGPEGSWSDKERQTFSARGYHPYRLGKYVLRAETAAVGAVGAAALLAQ